LSLSLYFISDPSEIGSAPMKYALHFIGQAFHPDGTLTTASFHRAGGAGRIGCMVRILTMKV